MIRISYITIALVVCCCSHITLAGPLTRAQDELAEGAGRIGAIHLYEIGLIPPATTKVIDHLFTIHNSSPKTPITLVRVVPSCGCMSSIVVPSAGANSKTVPPGKDIYVDVSIDPRLLTPGPFTKSVSVYIKGRKDALVELDMDGELLPAASFSPEILDFGSGRVGASRSVAFSATIDRTLLPDGMVAQLKTTDSDLLIEADPTTSKTSNTIKYTAKLLSTAHLGTHAGRINVVLTATDANGKKIDYPAGSLSVSEMVVGDISAVTNVVCQ